MEAPPSPLWGVCLSAITALRFFFTKPAETQYLLYLADGDSSTADMWVLVLDVALLLPLTIVSGWIGNLSDRIGRKPVLIMLSATTLIMPLSLIVAGYVANPLYVLVPSYVFIGFCGGGAHIILATCYASVSDCVPGTSGGGKAERTRWYGLTEGAYFIGRIAGPLGSGYLICLGYKSAFMVSVGFALLAIVVAARMPETLPADRRQNKSTHTIGILRDMLAPSKSPAPSGALLRLAFTMCAAYACASAFNRTSVLLATRVKQEFDEATNATITIPDPLGWSSGRVGWFEAVSGLGAVFGCIVLLPLLLKLCRRGGSLAMCRGGRLATRRSQSINHSDGQVALITSETSLERGTTALLLDDQTNEEDVIRAESATLNIGLITLMLGFSGFGVLVYWWPEGQWLIFLCSFLSGAGNIASPMIKSFFSRSVGPSRQGEALLCVATVQSFAGLLSPLVLMHIYILTPCACWVFIAMGLLMIAAIIAVWPLSDILTTTVEPRTNVDSSVQKKRAHKEEEELVRAFLIPSPTQSKQKSRARTRSLKE